MRLPAWLPTSFVLQSDNLTQDRKQLSIQYRLRAYFQVGAPDAANEFLLPLFATKQELFVHRKSGMTDLHFLDETENEWKGPYLLKAKEEQEKKRPLIKEKYAQVLTPSQTVVRCSCDRLFYYAGQEVLVETFIDNKQSSHTFNSVTIKLVRLLEGLGPHDQKPR